MSIPSPDTIIRAFGKALGDIDINIIVSIVMFAALWFFVRQVVGVLTRPGYRIEQNRNHNISKAGTENANANANASADA